MWRTQWLSRFGVALGGFLIFVGTLLIGIFILVYFDLMSKNIIENEKYKLLFLWALLVISVLDLVAGIILRRR